jgi:hypothetical protein
LGHVISEEGVVVEPENIKTTRDCASPKNITEVRSFMGLVGCYKRFVKGFSNIGHPITSF